MAPLRPLLYGCHMMTAPGHLHDLAIIGGGLFGSLLGLALRAHRPDIDFALIEKEGHFGGSFLEAAIANEIPDPIRSILDPAIVKYWPACFVNYPGRSERFEDAVLLVDPRQFHLEMVDHPQASQCFAGCTIEKIAGDKIVHSGGTLRARLIVDASDLRIQSHLEIERLTRYRDFRLDHDLDLPILADMSATAGDWNFLQLFPIDEERMIVEHFRHRPIAPEASIPADRDRTDSVIALATAGYRPSSAPDVAAVNFPSLLQMASEVAAGFVALDLTEPNIRAFFAQRTESGRARSQRMFELVRICRGAISEQEAK
ncbi:MAG: lycopene cyclase family protein [Sphingopyxis sp.]|uniref:lycopene cyclase family protein n=1 Tax=Sphingopyxis sp. TaxID=1908224 RepID=UPI003D6CE74A